MEETNVNITVYNEYRLEVKLSLEELKNYDITYDDFDYSNIETRRVLWTILDEAKHKSGTDINMSGKILIEVTSLNESGVSICFTSLPPRDDNAPSVKQLIKIGDEPIVLETDDINKCVDAAVSVDFSGKSALYEKNGTYRLVFFANPKNKGVLSARVCRFGTLRNREAEILLASSEELWNKIEGEAAVEKLCAIS